MNPINPYTGLPGTTTATGDVSGKARSGESKNVVSTTNTATASQATSASSVAQDHVTLSSAARSLMAAQNSSSADNTRVQEIKSAVANGTYSISAAKISQGLTQDSQQFLPLTPRNTA